MKKSGEWEKKREVQAVSWMWKEIKESLLTNFLNQPKISEKLRNAESEVKSGKKSPTQAAVELISSID
jgi:LAO/AO transport system kinase